MQAPPPVRVLEPLTGAGLLDWIDVGPNQRWLDAGCGTGAFTEALSKRCAPAAVSAVDPSEEQLAFARNRAGLEHADFRVGDAQDLPFAADSFDVAVMALVVHFLPDPDKAVRELARVLRPGGLAATYVWDYTKAGSPAAPVGAAVKAVGFAAPSPPSPKATAIAALEQTWRAAGLTDIETRTIQISVEFADFGEFWDSMTVPVGPAGKAIAQMSPDQVENLRAILRQRLPAASDGRVVYPAVANAIKGRKP